MWATNGRLWDFVTGRNLSLPALSVRAVRGIASKDAPDRTSGIAI
jgi:hypothetical protein